MTAGTPTRQAEPRGDRSASLVRWTPYVLLAVLLLALVRWVSAPVSNADTFFHLRYGSEFLGGWSLGDPGHVSTFGQRDWVPTQWASQVAMAATEEVFGLAGVVWLSGVVVLGTVLATFLVARRYADPLPAVVVTLLAVLATSDNLNPRPQVVSYLLLLLLTHVWLRTSDDLRPRWWLVPLTWAWASLHGMWPIGVLIGLVAVVGIALDRWPSGAVSRAVLLRLLAVPVLSLVAAGLTPVGPRLYGAVLLVGGRARFHGEWAATDFHMRQAAVAAVMLVLVLLVWLRSGTGRPDWTRVLLLLLAAAWSAYAVRTVPVAALMTVPLLAEALQRVVARRRAPPRREGLVLAGIAVGVLAALTAVVPVTAARPAAVPGWLDPALDALPEGTTVQTTDVIGGYVLWRHPGLNPVIDGYSDAYTTEHLQEQQDVLELRAGWAGIVRRTGEPYALLPARSKLAYALTELEGWGVVHAAPDVVLLESPGQADS